MKKKWFLVALILVICSANAYAEGVTPAKAEVEFTPNAKAYIPFKVTGYIQPEVTTDCPDYIKYNNDPTNNNDGSITFTTTLTLPSKMPQPGLTRCGVKIREGAPRTGSLIETRTELIAIVTINAPYPGEYAKIALTANNANQGDPIIFEISAENLGENAISNAQATIELTNEKGEKVATLLTETKDILPRSTATLTKEFDTKDYQPGRYTATARMQYKKGAATDKKGFIIGSFYVDIVSFTTNFETGKEEQFSINIENLWGNTIENAYADITLLNEGLTAAELKTAATRLSPWEKGALSTEINTNQFAPGEYQAEITLTYGKGSTTKTGEVTFELPQTEQEPLIKKITNAISNPSIVAAAISAIILIDMILIIRKKARKKRQTI